MQIVMARMMFAVIMVKDESVLVLSVSIDLYYHLIVYIALHMSVRRSVGP